MIVFAKGAIYLAINCREKFFFYEMMMKCNRQTWVCNAASFQHIFLILSHLVFDVASWCDVFSGEAANTTITVFDLTRQEFEHQRCDSNVLDGMVSAWLSWSSHFESFTFTTMTWLTVTEYLCHKWPGYVLFVVITIRFFTHSWLITSFFNKNNPQDATCGAGRTAYHSGAPKSSPVLLDL